MTIQKSIKILQHYNRWRRGAEVPMLEPKEIGQAIDKAIDTMKSVNTEPDNNPKK